MSVAIHNDLNLIPTNPNQPTRKISWKSSVMENSDPDGTQTLAIQLAGKLANHWARRPLAEQATKSTNKPYPFVKNMYYIVCIFDALHLDYSVALSVSPLSLPSPFPCLSLLVHFPLLVLSSFSSYYISREA